MNIRISPLLVFIFSFLLLTESSTYSNFAELDPYFLDTPEKTISMDFKDAALNDVMKIFSQQSGMNFIASTDVSDKRINLYLDNVPVEQALERILFANGLTYELSPGSNIFVVKELQQPAIQMATRIYPLKHATVKNSKMTTQMLSEEDATASEGVGILEAVKAVLSTEGKIVEDPRTNSLIITDLPSQFPLIEQTIARLDVRIPQILIEVEMLDISKNSSDLLGAKFGETPFTLRGGERDNIWPFGSVQDGDPNFEFEDPRYRVSTMSFAGLTMAVQFLRTQADTRSLARPRILTLNNETAEIEISTNETIGVIQSTEAAEGVGSISVEAERTDTGVFLKVTPQANLQTGEIVMAVEPRVIEAREGGTFSGRSFKDPEERKSKSILRILDGDTIVIGGLLRTDVTDRRSQVPILGNIPLLGAAFRHKDKKESERELIIFLTPHILKETFAPFTGEGGLVNSDGSILRERSIPDPKLDIINQELQFLEQKRP